MQAGEQVTGFFLDPKRRKAFDARKEASFQELREVEQ
jgi:hypothetical protein|tara:strand:+ start:262 stop:372 length:111 start_codon:yes stop_codon:yes gene_type:complete